jgi:geranylgeranyl diphosphate synthase type I
LASEQHTQAADSADVVHALLDVDALRARVERHLAGFLSVRVARKVEAGPDRILLDPVADLLLRAGKRLRPAFCYWGWRGAGGPDCDEVLAASTSLELLHGCALIHDDVMDRSALRRGGRTVHRELAVRHAELGWRGVSDHFGLAGAVVAGDLCLVWADEMLRASGLSAEALTRAGPVFDAMRAETIRGQYLDLIAQAEGALRVEDAVAVARAKTAASTTVGPLRFGGTLAGAGEDLLRAYAGYASPLGLAFQLKDDLIGAFGGPDATGKPSGDDLRDGKCTLLLAEARRRAGPRETRLIDELLVDGAEDAVDELRVLVERSGAREHVEGEITRLGTRAVAAVERAPLNDEAARGVLRGLALAVTTVDPLAGAGSPAAGDPLASAAGSHEPGEHERTGQERHGV